MKSFGVLVIAIFTVIIIASKAQQQPGDCNIGDVQDCTAALGDPNKPVLPKCCDEMRQHTNCFCLYKQIYPNIGDFAIKSCHIDYTDNCPK